MILIPEIDWVTRLTETTLFTEFNVVAQAPLTKAVQMALDRLPLNQNAAHELLLEVIESTQEPEKVEITVSTEHIKITGGSARAVFHGLTSLKWMLFQNKSTLGQGVYQGSPKFPNRGVFLDVSRGKVPNVSYLKDLVCMLADLKYNILQLYFEDKFLLADKPRIGILTGGYTKEQIKELDDWCISHHIELQPSLQTFSHFHGILNLPEYSHLAENENLFSLAAGKPEVCTFLDEVLGEVLSWFTSHTVHLNMDEAYDLGTGYSKARVEALGTGPVYLEHLQRVVEIARRHGAGKIIVWGDIAMRYPEVLDGIPDNVVLADWNYNPLTHFKSLENIDRYKGEFWAAGGISTWNSLFPRVYNSYTNLINYSVQAYQKGAQGFLVTDWGDYGHFQPLGLSLYGYMIGARQAYDASPIATFDLEQELRTMMFANPKVAEAFRFLMDSNNAPFIQTDFKSMSFYYFFDDLFNGLSLSGNDRYPRLLRTSFEILEEQGRKALARLNEVLESPDELIGPFVDEAWERLIGKFFVEELRFSARTTSFTGRKGLLSTEIKTKFEHKTITALDILEYIKQIKQLYSEFIEIRYDFIKIWNKRAHWLGIETTLLNFDKAGVQLGEAVRWLSNQYRTMENGLEPDYLMETYISGKKYKILWTADFKDMWESAYPWQ